MDLHVSVSGRHDLAGQVYRQLRTAIVEGRLAGGTRLPSTRELAVQLGVSRKTTLDAFERLLAEGYLVARRGSGTFVASGLQRLPAQRDAHEPAQLRMAALASRPARTPPGVQALPWWRSDASALPMPRAEAHIVCDFLGGVTDKTRFPFDVWRRCITDALRVQARGAGAYRDAAGEQGLRLAISRYLAFSRAVPSNWEDVIVTQGAQHALDLLARVTIKPRDIVAIEDPCYPPARAIFTALGATVVPVPVDGEGLVVEQLPEHARLVYVSPSHQFPLGVPMSLARRVDLLAWAEKRGALIVEDDYDCEYRFDARPLDPLKSLDQAGLVAYVGTFSKTLFPELRIGYVVPPATLAVPLARARQVGDWHGCVLTQTALASFMLNGHFARHLRRMHAVYAARRAMLLQHLQGPLARWLEPVLPDTAGLHLAARIVAPHDERHLLEAGRRVSVGLHPLSPFYVNAPAQPGLFFGYGTVETDVIDAGLERLAAQLGVR